MTLVHMDGITLLKLNCYYDVSINKCFSMPSVCELILHLSNFVHASRTCLVYSVEVVS